MKIMKDTSFHISLNIIVQQIEVMQNCYAWDSLICNCNCYYHYNHGH